MRLVKTFPFVIWAGLSALWAAVWLVVVLINWERSMAEVNAVYKQRENQCMARYSDAEARERCMLIMDLERFQTRSIAAFNRWLLIAGPPLIGLGVVVYLYRRRQRPIRRKR